MATKAERIERYARAICRVFVEETARVMRIKVTETWISTRVNSRWPEYADQAQASIAVADAEASSRSSSTREGEASAKAEYLRLRDAYAVACHSYAIGYKVSYNE